MGSPSPQAQNPVEKVIYHTKVVKYLFLLSEIPPWQRLKQKENSQSSLPQMLWVTVLRWKKNPEVDFVIIPGHLKSNSDSEGGI